MPTKAKPPSEWSADELACFELMVLDGGEVPPDTLATRIKKAEILVSHRERNCLVGVAALKNPIHSYKQKVFRKAWSGLPHEGYRFELGYIYIRPSFRGRKLSAILVAAAMEPAGTKGVFATTRVDNKAMQKTLKKFGFTQEGEPYESEGGDHQLILFIRPAK